MTITPQDRINGSSKKPTQKPAETKPTPSTPVANEACPFIGLEDDPSTRLLFASPVACCHRADPVDAVDLGHQQAYCLTAVYKLCPVFIRPEWDPLPVELAYHEPERPSSKNRWLWLIIGLVGLGLMAGALFIWGNGNVTPALEPEVEMPAVVIPPTKTPTLAPTVVDVSLLIPTKTAVASATFNPTNTNTPLPSTVTMEPSATLVPTYTPVPVLLTETAVSVIQAEVAVPFLNVRSGPGTAYDLLATVAEGEQIELTGRVSDSSWWLICCVNGESGWVISEAIEFSEEAKVVVPRVSRIPSTPTPTE